MSDIKLKPCPFCGGEGEINRFYSSMSIRVSVQILCKNCGGRSGSFDEDARYCADEKAAESWNRRVEHE